MGLSDEYYGRYTLMFDEHTFFVWDNDKEKRLTALDVTKLLNILTDRNNKQEIHTQDNEIARLKEENGGLRKQIQIYEQLIANSYVGEEETLDGFVGKYVIWEDELQKYKEKIKGVFDE